MIYTWVTTIQPVFTLTHKCGSFKTMNGKIGPIANQNYETWNCTIFANIWIFKGPNCVYISETFVVNN